MKLTYDHLTPKAIAAFDNFFSLVEVKHFKRHLRNLLLDHIIGEYEEPTHGYADFIEDMKFLLEAFDVIEDEMK